MSALPSLSASRTGTGVSPPYGLHHSPHYITQGCYVSPVSRRPIDSDANGLPTLSPLNATTGSNSPSSASSPSRSMTTTMRDASLSPSRYEVGMSPTGFNKPRTLMTPIRTVRRMFHYASAEDRKAFYEAFLDKPAPTKRFGN